MTTFDACFEKFSKLSVHTISEKHHVYANRYKNQSIAVISDNSPVCYENYTIDDIDNGCGNVSHVVRFFNTKRELNDWRSRGHACLHVQFLNNDNKILKEALENWIGACGVEEVWDSLNA